VLRKSLSKLNGLAVELFLNGNVGRQGGNIQEVRT
jgi:hypothetical protein